MGAYSRMAGKCRKCPDSAICNHKYMEKLAYIDEPAAQKSSIEISVPNAIADYNPFSVSAESLSEQIANSINMHYQMGTGKKAASGTAFGACNNDNHNRHL